MKSLIAVALSLVFLIGSNSALAKKHHKHHRHHRHHSGGIVSDSVKGTGNIVRDAGNTTGNVLQDIGRAL